MPDEREMAEINETIHSEPQPSSRGERRRILRDQPPPDRFTGIKRCDWCEATVELDREPLPERCDACGRPYDHEADGTLNADGSLKFTVEGIHAMSTLSTARRQAAAVESVAGAIEIVGEAVNRLADVFGDIGEAIAQRVGKAGR